MTWHMDTPARLIWTAAGQPDCGKTTHEASGPCYWCGMPCLGEAARVKDVCSKSFTDVDQARNIESPDICVPCAWTMTGKPPDTFRMWSVLYRTDVEPRRHEKAAECLHVPHTSIMGRDNLSEAVDVLLDPPPMSPWCLALAESGKIHTLPFAELNQPDVKGWSVRLERTTVVSTPAQFGAVLHHAAALYAVGYSKDDIRSGQPSPARVARLGIDQWREHDAALRARRGGPLCELALFLLRKDNADEYRDRTERYRAHRPGRGLDDRDDAVGQHRQDQPSRLVAESEERAGDSVGHSGELSSPDQPDGAQAPADPDALRDRQLSLFDWATAEP